MEWGEAVLLSAFHSCSSLSHPGMLQLTHL